MFIISTGNEVGLKALDIALQGSTDALLLKQDKRRRVLDVDSTEDPAHGNQENAAYFGANCFHSPVCLHERQRPPWGEAQALCRGGGFLLLSQPFTDLRGEFLAAQALLGTGEHGSRPGAEAGASRLKGIRQLFDGGFYLVLLELIDLGESEAGGKLALGQPFEEIDVHVLEPSSCVNKNDDPAQRIAVPQVLLYHPPPFVFYGERHFREPVAGKIGEDERIVHPKKINKLSFSRRATCFGEAFSANEGVDERGFSHVASPSDGDLGEGFGDPPLSIGGTGDELRAFDLHRRALQSVAGGAKA